MSDLIVRMVHVRKMRGCSRGARAFCERHDIDWAAFLRDGIDADILRATGDAMALKLVQTAEEAEYGRQQ